MTEDNKGGRGTLTTSFINALTNNGKYADIIRYVRSHDCLNLQIRDNYLNIYYGGGNILRIGERSLYFDKFYFYNDACGTYPKTYVEAMAKSRADKIPAKATNVPSEAEAKAIIDDLKNKTKKLMELLPGKPEQFFERAKEVMDLWFSKHPHQERKDQQIITSANTVCNSDSDLAIIDIEFAVSVNKAYNNAKNRKGNNKVCRFDIIAVDSVGQLFVIELKQNNAADSEDNSANVMVHKKDFDDTIGSDRNRLFAQEMERVVKTKHVLGILPASVKVDTSLKPVFAVAYSGRNPEAFNEKYRKSGIRVIEVLADMKLRK